MEFKVHCTKLLLAQLYFQQLQCDLLRALLNDRFHKIQNLHLAGWEEGTGWSYYTTSTGRWIHTNLQ